MNRKPIKIHLDVETIKKMSKNGKTYLQMAKYFGATRNQIIDFYSKKNLPSRARFWSGKKRHGIGKKILQKLIGRFKREKNFFWKGGKIIHNNYRWIIVDKHPYGMNCGSTKYVKEHRLVMEKHLGRFLNPSEIVHHIDGNPLNNLLENLVITNRRSHASFHVIGNKFAKKSRKLSSPIRP